MAYQSPIELEQVRRVPVSPRPGPRFRLAPQIHAWYADHEIAGHPESTLQIDVEPVPIVEQEVVTGALPN